jgi:hypothetical protein
MKITKQKLKQIIKEEISKVLSEDGVPMDAPASVPWQYSEDFINGQIELANTNKDPWDLRSWYDEFIGGRIEPTGDDKERIALAIQQAQAGVFLPEDQIKQAYNDLAKYYGEGY